MSWLKVSLVLPSKGKEKGKRNASTMKRRGLWMFGMREMLGFVPHVLCLSSVTILLNVFSMEHTVIHLIENVTNKVTNA